MNEKVTLLTDFGDLQGCMKRLHHQFTVLYTFAEMNEKDPTIINSRDSRDG
jgi:hypothetical protein